MDIRSQAPAQLPDASVADLVDFLRAVQCCDAPHQPPVTAVSYRRMVLHGWDGQGPEQLWQAYEGDDLVALASMWLSHWDNLHLAFVDVSVRPDRRRRGIGSALLKQLADAAKSAGRTTMLTEALGAQHHALVGVQAHPGIVPERGACRTRHAESCLQ